jgi:hypothetical protein
MGKTAERTNPELWEEVKAEVKQGSRGGEAGEWSASKAQLAVQEYKKRGGGYRGKKSGDVGERYTVRDETGGRGVPERKGLGSSPSEQRTGETIAVGAARSGDGKPLAPPPSKADLLSQAKMLEIEGRSRMTKDDLAKAIRYAKH